MNSAPAVLLQPAVLVQPVPCLSPAEPEAYPWATQTPEPSPRLWEATPTSMYAAKEMSLSHDMIGKTCQPFFEQMLTSLEHRTSVDRDILQASCEPYFGQMVVAMQHVLHKGAFTSMGSYPSFFHQSASISSFEEVSTDASGSCAFSSLFSGTSSEGESLEAMEQASDVSEGEPRESIMVCKHWKSKGWCRMESNCKFLHPEHKRGSCCLVPVAGKDLAAPPTSSQRRRRRGGKKQSAESRDEFAVTQAAC